MKNDVTSRLLIYARSPKHTIQSEDARAFFNDLQLMLSSDHTVGLGDSEDSDEQWNPVVEEDIVQVRNLMNMCQCLIVNGELKGRWLYNEK
jgi:hypothetical protein